MSEFEVFTDDTILFHGSRYKIVGIKYPRLLLIKEKESVPGHFRRKGNPEGEIYFLRLHPVPVGEWERLNVTVVDD